MSIRKDSPCEVDGICPYEAEYSSTCEYYCSAEEPEDYPEWEDDYLEMGFNPYKGGYDYDC